MPGAVSPVMKPASALRLLRWVVLALVFAALGRAGAQDTHRLDLDQTRAALTAAETSLKAGNLDDADLQALRAQSDALALALAGGGRQTDASARGLGEAPRRADAESG